MKLIANGLNRKYLRDILPPDGAEVDGVLAAIAYGSNSNDEKNDLLGHCLRNRYRLDIWMRYDHTVPVAIPLMKRLLRHHKDNIFCRLIPDCLHSKVIWWKGYGAYIGSANLTERAWATNIEAGVFFSEGDLQRDGVYIELEAIFERLKELDVAFPLSDEVVKEMEQIESRRKSVHDLGKELRNTPVWEGLAFYAEEKASSRRKESFRKEWHETLTILRDIGNQLTSYRPVWVEASIPVAWQIDQFLHAYYYNKVGDSKLKPYEDYFSKNRKNPNAALVEAMSWWSGTSKAPSGEDLTFYDNAPFIQKALSEENILNLSVEQFADVCGNTHATLDHIIKMDLVTLGRADVKTLSREERVPLYAEWLLKQRNAKGWSALQLLNYVLYGGHENELWDRLYTSTRDPSYTLPHYGLNSIAELVGWARPEVAPPRNGRTSKALRALGFDVRIY